MFGIGEAIAAGSNMVSTVVDKIWPDANLEEKAKLELALTEMNNRYQLMLSQIETNRVQASNPSVFVAGGRPFILWVCGIGLAYASIIEPLFNGIAITFFDVTERFPPINTDVTLQLLFGMLGLSGYRSYEKNKGVARENMK